MLVATTRYGESLRLAYAVQGERLKTDCETCRSVSTVAFGSLFVIPIESGPLQRKELEFPGRLVIFVLLRMQALGLVLLPSQRLSMWPHLRRHHAQYAETQQLDAVHDSTILFGLHGYSVLIIEKRKDTRATDSGYNLPPIALGMVVLRLWISTLT